MEKRVSIRIGLDGKANIVGNLREIGVEGKAAGDKTAYGFDKASDAGKRLNEVAKQWANAQVTQSNYAAMFGIGGSGKSAAESFKVFEAEAEREAARLKEISQAKAQQLGENFQNSLNAAMGIGQTGKSARESASVFEEESKQIEELDRQAAALKAQINPLAVAQDRLNAETAQYNALLRAGKITQVEHTAAMAAATTRYNQAAVASQRMAAGNKLSAFQISNLSFQINDVVSGLAMGQKPLQILTQQGGQFYQIFQGSGMGVIGALKATGSLLAGLLSPTLLIGGAIAGLGAGFAYLEYRGIKTTKELEAALVGTGRAAGVTTSQLNDMAVAAATASNTSIGQSREWAEQAAKTGKIPGQAIEQVTSLIPNYAATTDQEQKDAAKELIGAFADLSKGVETLDAKTGAFDYQSRTLVKTLWEEGQYAEAARVAYEHLNGVLTDHMQQMTAWGRFWHGVGTEISNAFDRLSHDATAKEQLEKYQRYQKIVNEGGTVIEDRWYGKQRIDADEIAEQLRHWQQVYRDELKRTEDEFRASAAKIKADLAAPILLKIVPSFEEADFRRQLGIQHYNLRQLLGDSGAMQRLGVTSDQVNEGLSAVEHADSTYTDTTQKFVKAQALETDALSAKTPKQKADIAMRREAMSLDGQEVSARDVATRTQTAYTAALAAANYQLSQQNMLLNANIRQTQSVASAWLKGSAEAMEATAHRQALQESIQSGISVGARERQLLAQSIASQGETVAQTVAKMQAETAARKAVNDAVASGATSYSDANRQIQVGIALIDLRAAKEAAVNKGLTAQAALLQTIIDAYEKISPQSEVESRRAAALQSINEDNLQLAMLRQQLEREQGQQPRMPSDEQKTAAMLADKNTLLEKGYAIEKDGQVALTAEGQKWLQIQQSIMAVNRELDLTKAANDNIYAAESAVFDNLGSMLASSKQDWSEYFKSIYTSFEKLALQLMLINPLKNILLGGDASGKMLPTISSVGGWLGSLLGNEETIEPITVTGTKGALSNATASGGSWISQLGSWFAGLFHEGGVVGAPVNSNRMLPANVIRFAPRLHDGAYLAADEVPAILQTGERVLNRSEARRYNQGNGITYVPVTIQASDPRSFKASRGQIAASLARAVQTGARRI
jgi:hypothetical protein